MAVSYITEFANSVQPTDVLGRMTAPYFAKSNTMLGLCYTEELPVGTMTKKLTRKGGITAVGTVAESTAVSLAAGGEITDSASTGTIAKCAVVSGLSVEAEQFSRIDYQRIAEDQGANIARFVDDDALSLFGGFSQSVTCTAGTTTDDLFLAQYTIFASECPNKNVKLKYVGHHRGVYNLKTELKNTSASAWTNQTYLQILGGLPQANNFHGEIMGIDIYGTSGHTTSGGDTVQGVFHPVWALAAFLAPRPEIVMVKKGSEGLYTEITSYFFYDVFEYCDLAGVKFLSDT